MLLLCLKMCFLLGPCQVNTDNLKINFTPLKPPKPHSLDEIQTTERHFVLSFYFDYQLLGPSRKKS